MKFCIDFLVLIWYDIVKELNTLGGHPMETYSAADMADILHRASMLYTASNIPIDYGTGEKYTSVEVHMLKYIIDHPGKTVTDLSQEWDRSKAAISQMLKRMEEKGLITWRGAPDSKKKQLYFATPQGEQLNERHLEYDERVFGKTLELLGETCSQEEIAVCFHVLEEYTKVRRKKHYHPDPMINL
mgnify:CR=1 FL=1